MSNTDSTRNPEPSALRGDDAVALWQKGPGAWNDWIANHPGVAIDFSGVDFSSIRPAGGELSFEGYRFGDGNVSFYRAKFDDGDVSFKRAEFGKSDVSFDDATFGDGEVIFAGANLAHLWLVPREAPTALRCGSMIVGGSTTLDIPAESRDIKTIDLRNASFDGPLTLKGATSTPPDLRGTQTKHHVELSGLKLNLRRVVPSLSWPPFLSRVADEPTDAARLRRLKEIAETNRDHGAALRFSADENRALRWRKTGWLASVLDMMFSGFSNYGQSIWRPVAALIALALIGAIVYYVFADVPLHSAGTTSAWEQAFRLSLSNSLPIMPQSRTIRLEASDALYAEPLGLGLDAVMMVQGMSSFILLFLIGLGLRNRFRL